VTRATRSTDEPTVPLGLVLITVGAIVVVAAVAVWLLLPLTAATSLAEQFGLAKVDAQPTTVAEAAAAPADRPIILLPETPLNPVPLRFDLPSEASVASAPTALYAEQPGQPIRLQIPSLNIDAPVYEVGLEQIRQVNEVFFQWAVPTSYAAGWHGDSALLGQPGNTVLNGHHNIHGQVFRDLVDVQIGAELIVEAMDGRYQYRIIEKLLLAEQGQPLSVRQANARWIEPTDDERITIVTCWPATGNSHRLLVVALPWE
jgi:LPXTG-site transpeptidase (sortase) family protein